MSTLTAERNITQSQKMMIFILAMAVFGLSELVTQIVPEISFGPIDLNVAYFSFIPVTLAALFAPAQVALGAVTGSVIFGSLLMGDFGGIGELEGFIQLSIGIFTAGMIVSNPLNKKQIFLSAVVCVGIDKLIGGIVDTLKVVIGVEQFEAVAGLPQSVYVLEGIAFFTDLLIAGVLFGAIPALYLVPKLYGKIEHLLGMKPRKGTPEIQWSAIFTVKRVVIAILLFIISGVVAILDEMDIQFGVWEPDFIDQFGTAYLYIGIAVAAVFLVGVILYIKNRTAKAAPSHQGSK